MIFWPELYFRLWLALVGWPFLMPWKEVVRHNALQRTAGPTPGKDSQGHQANKTTPPVTDAGGTVLQFPHLLVGKE